MMMLTSLPISKAETWCGQLLKMMTMIVMETAATVSDAEVKQRRRCRCRGIAPPLSSSILLHLFVVVFLPLIREKTKIKNAND